MKALYVLILALIVTGCTHNVTPDDTSNCWRFGVAMDNTGKMSPTPISEIPTVKLGYEALLVACGVDDARTLSEYYKDGRTLAVRACYDPMTDTIYEYKLNLGSYFNKHEQCHLLLGRNHNRCNSMGYGIGKDESACNWDTET